MAPTVLAIAGTDCSGGAGLGRDIETLTRLGVSHRSIVTAVTAQTDRDVTAVHAVPQAIVASQLQAALTSNVHAIKIGMLGTKATIAAVATALPDFAPPIVLDPVLISSSGKALLAPDAIQTLVSRLFPHIDLLTPNLAEAARLTGMPQAQNRDKILAQAHALLALGPKSVLIKGGHGTGATSEDILFETDRPPVTLSASRLTATLRGTGCALSSAIAAGLAMGQSRESACRNAKAYVRARLAEAETL